MKKTERRNFLAFLGAVGTLTAVSSLSAKPPELTEPVHRVAIAPSVAPGNPIAVHPLDRAIELAKRGLSDCRANVKDYTALMIKRERIDGELGASEFIVTKVRNRKIANGKVVQPLSVYLHFLRPTSIKGREVIFVEGENDGNIVAHEGGFRGKFFPTVKLAPEGSMAMKGQRYPMTEIGIENLMVKLIERGELARQFPDVRCEFRKNANVKGRVCTVLQVTQPTKRPELEFYRAQVFIDDALNMPIRYVAYDWPKSADAKPPVLEEYTYLNLKVNVGLTDKDFDPYNEAYRFHN